MPLTPSSKSIRASLTAEQLGKGVLIRPMSGPGAPSLQHAPSTSDSCIRRRPARGAPGCWGTRWWTRRGAPYGWCCGCVYPSDHLAPDQVRWEPAPEVTGPLL